MPVKNQLTIILLLILCLGCAKVEKDDKSEINKIGANIKEPPNLMIVIGEQTIRAAKGTYSWSYYEEGSDEVTHVDVDTAPPPELVNIENATTVHSDAEVSLLFDYGPKDYTVRVWNSEKAIASYKKVELAAYEGIVIYEIEANWEQGTASYAFAVDIEE